MHLKHTLEIFIDDNSKYLILGSFPSVKSREYNFYYSHPTNRFFKVLYEIFDEPYSTSIEDRKVFLREHNIALYDVIEECDIESSYDASIKNVIPIDIVDILSKYPNIKSIGITGGKATSLFKKYLLDKIDTSKIKITYLGSTSSANAKMSVDDLVEQFKEVFE